MNTPSNDNIRSPESHRACISAWASKAPSTDGKIFPRAAKSKSPRHADLAEQCRPILRWKALWEAAESNFVQSSWMVGAGLVDDGGDDEDESPTGPSVEGVSRDWLPNRTGAIEAQLKKLLVGTEQESKPEYRVRRVDLADVEALRAEGRTIKTATVEGEERAIEIIEARTRVLIVGGKVAHSTFSGRLVRAGDIKFADGLRGADAANDNLDIEADDEEEEAEDDEEAGLVAADRFQPGVDELEDGNDDLHNDHPAPVLEDEGYNNGVRAGSVIGQFKRYNNGGKVVEVVVPFQSKLEFTDRSSAPPPAREVLSVEEIGASQDELTYVCSLLCEETVQILNRYRAQHFTEIGQLLGRIEKTAQRRGRDVFPVVCGELAAATTTYRLVQETYPIREAA